MKRILLSILVIGILLLGACAAPTYTLSTSVSPSGAGSVLPSDGQYEEGTQVTLTATPARGYTFDCWDGDASGSSATITLAMDLDKSVIATFTQITYDLTMNVVGNGTISPESGVHIYLEGAVVEISATPDEGWEFSGWSGDITDTSATAQITMDSDKSVIAHFADIAPPVISEIDISTITDTKATVKWDTDELTTATSFVEYGESDAYGDSIEALDDGLTTSHSALLVFLKTKTTYHFRICAVDEAGNKVLSDDYTFTTKATEELLSATMYPVITIGGYVYQLGYNLSNNSSQTITVTKVEFFDGNGNVKYTVSQSTLQGTSHKGQLLSGNTFNWSVSFQIPYSTEEIEGWQVKWYCLDAHGEVVPIIRTG